ncbi:MAG: S8 family serine peptidase [Candidatus Thalassarchaeaceae archaeon]
MSSGNARGSGLSLLLVMLMILPSFLAIAVVGEQSEREEFGLQRGTIEYPGFFPLDPGAVSSDNPAHGWIWDKGNIETASLAFRTASYVPIQEWTQRTGEGVISGWHTLGRDYPIPSDWISNLEEEGMECRTFYAPVGLHCNVPKLSPAELMDLGVIGAFRLAGTDKMSPGAIAIANGLEGGLAIREGDDYAMLAVLSGSGHFEDLIETGVEVQDYKFNRFVDLLVSPKEIEMLVSKDFVEWIEPKYPASLDNEVAATINGAEWVSTPSNMAGNGGALSGDGVIVAVMDSGLDNAAECNGISHCNSVNSGINADFSGRIRGVVSYAGSTCATKGGCGPDDNNGHGTHVAGSVLGDGSNSPVGWDNAGMAPGAQLFMQSVGWKSTDSALAPPSYGDGFQEAYNAGARVHTNSWGTPPDCATEGNLNSGLWCLQLYSATTESLDTAAHQYQDLTILFSMGNDGRDCVGSSFATDESDPDGDGTHQFPAHPYCASGKNGEINLGILNQQASAKNIISVGASETQRQGTGLNVFDTYYGGAFYGAPILNEYDSDDPDGVWGRSNRGPTSDGRIKPDLVSPGSSIVSVKSSQKTDQRDLADGYYTVKSGTSMATPITAGSVALLIEYLNNHGYDCNLANSPSSNNCPDSALIKGILSASSHDMVGQYSSGGDGENGAVEKAPNNHEGWGRVDLERAVGSAFTSGIDITTSDSHSFKLSVPDSGIGSLRVVLSWNEASNGASAGTQLRNDLDIHLKSPTGVLQTYTNDDFNNLIGISVDSPDAGDWEVIVTGVNVIDGSQKYYLAASDGVISDMRHPISDGFNQPGFQSGSIFTETTISSGGDHICTILGDSELQCWGDNAFGQLGDGTTADRQIMTAVGLDSARTAVSVSSGEDHTCSILDNGEIQCWGRNNFGQLGDGSNSHSSTPVEVTLGEVPVQLSAGDWHTCAILDDASLKCWGRNNFGQLGDGTNSDSSTPVTVSLPGEKFLAVSAGSNHTCAVSDSWAVSCWGSNQNGQLGIGTTVSSNTPSTVTVGGSVVAVSAGGSHTCAILDGTSGGDVKCWGDNAFGQLGDGTTTQQNDASTVTSPVTGAITIDVGRSHTCIVDSSDSVHCWGGSDKGQVGDGSTSAGISSPTAITLGQNLGAISVASGKSYTCVVGSNDLPRCWGGVGSDAPLGDEPTEFSGISRWSYIGSSERDWNNNGDLNIFEVGVMGDGDKDGFPSGSDSDDTNPTVAANCSPGNYGRFACREATPGYYVSGSGNTVMTPASPGHYVNSEGAISQTQCPIGKFQELTGQTSCEDARPGYYVPGLGASEGTPCPAGKYNDQYGMTSDLACQWAEAGHSVPVLTQVSSGAFHSCAILDDGSVSCWGENSNGQLGDGTRDSSLEPERASMPLGRKAIEISSGSYHTCTLLDDGSIRCWGDNAFGQLGDGTTIERTTPVTVDLGPGMSATGVSSGESHTCAVLNDKSVKCWGLNRNGQLGDNSFEDSLAPVHTAFEGIEVLEISSGSFHTCAITSDRSVMCWGENWNGQLGDGSNSDRNTPVQVTVPSNSSAVTIDSGAFHTCLGMNDGTMFCWGYNEYGQLGNGATSDSNAPQPSPLSPDLLLMQVGVGLFHSCGLFDTGEVACWGGNSNGQLGDGTQTSHSSPEIITLSTNASSIAVGHRHTCAILDDASLKCWGANEYGQVGDGSTSDLDSPASIDLGHGSKEQVPCPRGSYQPLPEKTTCILSDRGFMVPSTGQTDQVSCQAGYYSSLRGQHACTPAARGFYVSGNEATSQTQCPSGQSTLSEASTFFDDCFSDFDADGIPDQIDEDDDNDGVPDQDDYDPLDPEVSFDSDGDRIPDSIDTDDDNDGVNDTEDPFPNDQNEWEDFDGDGIGDNSDDDDDGDGRPDSFDVFPNDPNEWSDADGDGWGNNVDPDDDNDGRCDDTTYHITDEFGALVSNRGPDLDGDGAPDCLTSAKGDEFPLDANETDDTDGDSIGNNQDTDCDGDGWLNPVPCNSQGSGEDGTDAFPLEADKWSDSDGDGFADQGSNVDAFPDDPSEWLDTDGDSVGNNADECPYEFGISSQDEDFIQILALPGNDLGCPVQTIIGDEIVADVGESEDDGFEGGDDSLDFDGDGISDAFDTDDDGDGIPDLEDGVLGDEKWSKDPFRPFTGETWAILAVSVSFIGVIAYRSAGWKKRGIANIRSRRIRIQ